MDRKRINKKAKPVELKSDSNKEFFLIHGYTGSPSDFNNLVILLNKEFSANVKVPLLPGHGTVISDLENYSYKDFFDYIEKELKKSLKSGREIIVGGYSFGALIALYLASKYPLKGVFIVAPPYRLSLFLQKKPLIMFMKSKRFWKKPSNENEIKQRKKAFYYNSMPGITLEIIKQSCNHLDSSLRNISCPVLVINSKKDIFIPQKSIRLIMKKIKSKIKESLILTECSHNPFYTEENKFIISKIIKFFKYDKKALTKVSAIVPAYNEGKRIGKVLSVLSKSKIIDEIIVIDDGSSDNTEKIVKKFSKIKYFKNKINMGKAYSMNRGVELSRNEILFFCDADLNGLNEEIVYEIVNSVVKRKYDMFIGVRGNFMQKTWKLVALNSGERAIRRDVWEGLPRFYKHRYRIEYGLNKFITSTGMKLGYKVFPYQQTLKEKKHGFIKGTFYRWWLNLDVFTAILRFNLYDRWILKL